MKNLLKIKFIIHLSGLLVFSFLQACQTHGHTVIEKWQYGKKGAVSITFDDGSANQFVKAVPVMNELNLPGTFFIVTGSVPGSKYKAGFTGRPVKEIIKESKTISTNKNNFYERASAARFVGYKGASEYFTDAGAEIDAGRDNEAYKIMDELYRKVNNGEFQPEQEKEKDRENVLTWDLMKNLTEQGHEFASHMVDHPYLGALDEPNMLYEIEKSREEILSRLGSRYTFSAETPYCSQDKRVMNYTGKIYPAIRSQITDEFFRQIRFSDHSSTIDRTAEYVQWQRGLYTRTSLAEMKAWVDTTLIQNNIWLVLIIHGIDGIGWEPLKSAEVDEYFRYIKSKEPSVWIATYGDITRYIRERKNAAVTSSQNKGKISVTLTLSLDQSVYDVALTLKTAVPARWKEVTVKQGNTTAKVKTQSSGKDTYVLYQAMPNAGSIDITKSSKN